MAASRARRRDRGAAAVEFALVLPVLLLIIFGIIDFGRMLTAKITLTEAAREGARAAALVGSAEASARINAVVAGLDIDEPSIDGCPDPPDPTADATVTITYQFQFITPISALAGIGGDGGVELSATGLMPCLQ
jgi:hypothetical protein